MHEQKLLPRSMPKTIQEPSGSSSTFHREQVIKLLVTQAYLTLSRKMPIDPTEGKLFLDGWISALKSVPTDFLRDAFSDALASGKPFTPGTVCEGYREAIGIKREKIKTAPFMKSPLSSCSRCSHGFCSVVRFIGQHKASFTFRCSCHSGSHFPGLPQIDADEETVKETRKRMPGTIPHFSTIPPFSGMDFPEKDEIPF